MVAGFKNEDPNLSYVRINQGVSSGSSESIKGFITKGLSSSDPRVINAALLHKSLVEQPVKPPLPTTPLWRPEHLYQDEENEESSSVKSERAGDGKGIVTGVGSPTSTTLPATSPALSNSAVTDSSSVQGPQIRTTTVVTGTRVAAKTKVGAVSTASVVTAGCGVISTKTVNKASQESSSVNKLSCRSFVSTKQEVEAPRNVTVITGIKRKPADQLNVTPAKAVKLPTYKIIIEPKKKVDETKMQELVQKNSTLLEENARLKEANKQLLEKMEKIKDLMRNPQKLKLLGEHLMEKQSAAVH